MKIPGAEEVIYSTVIQEKPSRRRMAKHMFVVDPFAAMNVVNSTN